MGEIHRDDAFQNLQAAYLENPNAIPRVLLLRNYMNGQRDAFEEWKEEYSTQMISMVSGIKEVLDHWTDLYIKTGFTPEYGMLQSYGAHNGYQLAPIESPAWDLTLRQVIGKIVTIERISSNRDESVNQAIKSLRGKSPTATEGSASIRLTGAMMVDVDRRDTQLHFTIRPYSIFEEVADDMRPRELLEWIGQEQGEDYQTSVLSIAYDYPDIDIKTHELEIGLHSAGFKLVGVQELIRLKEIYLDSWKDIVGHDIYQHADKLFPYIVTIGPEGSQDIGIWLPDAVVENAKNKFLQKFSPELDTTIDGILAEASKVRGTKYHVGPRDIVTATMRRLKNNPQWKELQEVDRHVLVHDCWPTVTALLAGKIPLEVWGTLQKYLSSREHGTSFTIPERMPGVIEFKPGGEKHEFTLKWNPVYWEPDLTIEVR